MIDNPPNILEETPHENYVRFTTEDSQTTKTDYKKFILYLLWPGTCVEFLVYLTVRWLPLLISFIWLLFPLGDYYCPSTTSETPCQSIWLYIVWHFGYMIFTIAFCWSFYHLAIPFPHWSLVILSSLISLIISPVYFIILRFSYFRFRGLLFPISLLLAVGPIVILMLIHSWWVGKKYHLGTLGYVVRFTLVTLLISFTYYYCQLYVYLYETFTTDVDKVFFSTFFPISMRVLKAIGNLLTEAADKETKTQMTKWSVQQMSDITVRFFSEGLEIKPVCMFMMDMFYFMFQRNLFISLSTYWSFLLFQTFNVLFEFLFTPLRLSKFYWRVTDYLSKLVAKILKRKAAKPTDQEEVYKNYCEGIAKAYFLRSTSQFISLSFFVISFTWLYFGYNREYFPLKNFQTNDLTKIYAFWAIALGFEIISVSIISVLFGFAIKTRVTTLGMTQLTQSYRQVFAFVFAAIHVIQDVFIARNDLNFCRWFPFQCQVEINM